MRHLTVIPRDSTDSEDDERCDWCGGPLTISKSYSEYTLCSAECADEWKAEHFEDDN